MVGFDPFEPIRNSVVRMSMERAFLGPACHFGG
jgi:hypothetical protein